MANADKVMSVQREKRTFIRKKGANDLQHISLNMCDSKGQIFIAGDFSIFL